MMQKLPLNCNHIFRKLLWEVRVLTLTKLLKVLFLIQLMSEDTNLEPMVYRRGVEGGGAEDFWGDLKFFLKREKGGFAKIFDRRRREGCNFFSPLIKKGSIILGFFFLSKKGSSNYSMLEERFLARFIKIPFTGLSLLISKSSVFIVNWLPFSQQQLQNFNEKFNRPLTEKLPMFQCLAAATEIKINEWTEIEL